METETQTIIEEVVQPPKNKGGRPRKGSGRKTKEAWASTNCTLEISRQWSLSYWRH